jgi:hypothetical protein
VPTQICGLLFQLGITKAPEYKVESVLSPNSRLLVQLCSSLGRMYNRFLVWWPSTSKMPPLKEDKLLACVSSVDCQATWLRIVPLGSRITELISSSVHKGNKISPSARLTM